MNINQPINLLFGKMKDDYEKGEEDKIYRGLKLNKNIKLNMYPVKAGKIRVRLQNI